MKRIAIFILAVAVLVPASFARITNQGATDADIWCVGPDGAEVCVDSSGNLIPTTDDDTDLGTSSLKWQDMYIDGTAYIDNVSVTGGILNSDLASSVQNTADTTITSAQILLLSNTSIEIVPAPGAGYANIFLGALLFADNTTAYTVTATGGLAVRYGEADGAILALKTATGFIDSTSDKVAYVYPSTTYLDTGLLLSDNKAIVLHSLTTEPTAGTGTIKVRAFYRVVPTAL
jgi:hypothetical protein